MKRNNKFTQALKSTIKLATETGDNATSKILEQILDDEMVLANDVRAKAKQTKPTSD